MDAIEDQDASVDERLGDVAAKQHGVFTRHDAVEAGATEGVIRHRLRTKRWARVHPGVYRLAGAPTTWRQSLCAATLAAGDGAAAATLAAAVLQQIPGFREG